MSQHDVISIQAEGKTIALFVPAHTPVSGTSFVTGPEHQLQVGFVARAAGESIPAHRHAPPVRNVQGTPEVLILRKGRCWVTLYDDNDCVIRTLSIREGDVLVLLGGGHGMQMEEDSTFLEVKQGPFIEGEKVFLPHDQVRGTST